LLLLLICHALLQGDVYNHCPAWTMAWHYRKRNLLKELLTHRPDIMCLQEVQSDHFSEYLHPELTKAGYMGIYKKKTTEIFTGSQYTIDGCATFFRCVCRERGWRLAAL
jgi:CCR4-NOT transcription complex subunit 6